MAPAMRLITAMTGLVLLTALALLSLSYRTAGTPVLWAELAVVAGILVLAVALAWTVAPDQREATAAVHAGRLDNAAAARRARTSAFLDAGLKRQTIERVLEQYAQRDRMFSAVVESARHPIITLALDGTITSWNPIAE